MKRYIFLLFIGLLALSCKKLIETGDPKNQLTTDKVFADSTSATAALGNLYAQFERGFEPNFTPNIGLYTDELNVTSTGTNESEFLQSRLSVTNSTNLGLWQVLYAVIYGCNDLLEKTKSSPEFPASKVTQLTSEARFLRAYAYFYLVNMYGRVPLLLSTNAKSNRQAAQNDQGEVYQQIITDLQAAKLGLTEMYLGPGKTRANKWAAGAMLARVYLNQKNWAAAEEEASQVISSGLYLPLDPVADVFKSGSRESILQFWTQQGFISSSANLLPASDTSLPAYPITDALYTSFEAADVRKSNWTGTSIVTTAGVPETYHYSAKYKNKEAGSGSPEYLMALRLSEQYLIRAEARAWLGRLQEAQEDLNVIRHRAGLLNTRAENQLELLGAIAQERRVELFGEWGARFIDLKRTGTISAVLGSYKNTWKPTAAWFPIPQSEINYNNKLIQNLGYN
ncbi:RagB/SusD family nutrient uptake outer membrane protein [Pedobacter sp.]|uniref:RagB/SusD family nutrient uptake outer membrane protein n=1 Tax=Pedobacter sp. TaxID=1411316 RepID=UPI002C5D0BA2|nr:RagB/SusD family nutrient uptake outer membrane protein [Pedobacter sp.]HWW38290.1 RagB/SusD family nutrient uptake outer membrane protein [Pedobacter sp.]